MPSATASLSVEDAINRRRGDLVELSHSIHAEPELAFAEHRSCAKTQALVAEYGFEITSAAGGLDTAFRASYGSGPLVVGVCAEYDALPEIGHACGHNIIAASAVGTALALADVADELGLTVVLIGTPAEEHAFPANVLPIARPLCNRTPAVSSRRAEAAGAARRESRNADNSARERIRCGTV